jgi:hypothetical protein
LASDSKTERIKSSTQTHSFYSVNHAYPLVIKYARTMPRHIGDLFLLIYSQVLLFLYSCLNNSV